MMLRIPKRLKSEEDRKLLVEIARDIFDRDIPTETTLRKYFRFTSDISTTDNIAYKKQHLWSSRQDRQKADWKGR